MYLDAKKLYGWEMFRKLPVDEFKWIDDLSTFNENRKKKLRWKWQHRIFSLSRCRVSKGIMVSL